MTSRARSLALSALVIWSAVLVGIGPSLIGPAEAQTDAQTHTFDGSQQGADKPRVVAVDVSNMTGTVTVEWSTGDTGSPSTYVLERRTVTAPFSANELAISNQGAYSTVNVTVTGGSGNASFNGYENRLTMPNDVKTFGGTGGDRNRICNLHEKISQGVDPGFTMLDCVAQPGTTAVNTTGTDAAQVETDIYQSAQNSEAAFDNYNTTLRNYLQDTETQALIIAKNQYIRELNNGSSKSAAETAAINAAEDYYAVKQANLLNEWTRQVEHHEYLNQTAMNESGVSKDFVWDTRDRTYDSGSGIYIHADRIQDKTRTVTLVNGSTQDVRTLGFTIDGEDSSYNDGGTEDVWVGPSDGRTMITGNSGSQTVNVTAMIVKDPDNSSQRMEHITFEDYKRSYDALTAQEASVEGEIGTLVNNTYDAYQQGKINTTDLIDPYVLASERSPDSEFQGWAASQLTLLGQNSPSNFDTTGAFEVTTGNETYEGIVFSPQNPASGQFEANTTYDAANISGTQYLVTANRTRELTGTFTLGNITAKDGERVQNVTIEKTTYQTSNVTELKQLYEDLAYERAKIEAREQALRAAAGGGGLLGGSMNATAALVVVALVLALGIINN